MKLLYKLLPFLFISIVLTPVPVKATAEETLKPMSNTGYLGASIGTGNDSAQYNFEANIPIADNLQLRGTTDFHDELDVLATTSVGLGDNVSLYAGPGLNFNSDEYMQFLLRGGVDVRVGNSVIITPYLDYVDDRLYGNVGVAYPF